MILEKISEMIYSISHTSSNVLLHLAIKDACSGYKTAATWDEADSIVTVDQLRENILEQLEKRISEREKEYITTEFLKSELRKNNLKETSLLTEDGRQEVWFLKRV
jgi:hypothetical protein